MFAGPVQASTTILVTGDSLSAAYGIPIEQGWVNLLQKRLDAEGYLHQVINTSVSGETTSGGLARLAKDLDSYKPSVVIIELGANDGLRGLSLDAMKANLAKMVQASQQAGSRVLLLGMRIPSNYGVDYTERFHQTFSTVAEQNGTALVPFLFDKIALNREMFQDDGIHPTVSAQPLLLDTVWPALEPLLERK